MSNSNFRCKDYDTVHHITSRIAHRVFFLAEDERNDMIDIMRRSSQFCGIQLLAWAIMNNHFHLLVHLPVRPADITEDEIMRRYEILKGPVLRQAQELEIASLKAEGEADKVKAWFDRQRSRMYDIGEFMKLVKQWFTQEYNRRQAHVGTLWEAPYYDRVVEYKVNAIARCAAYIHLNPIRSALCAGFADYPWSSFNALHRGDALALAGMRFVYDAPEASADELIARHSELLTHLLEKEKRRRAEEIARKRLAGYEVPLDPLTSEALVAQAEAHVKRVQEAGVVLHEESAGYRRCIERRKQAEECMLELMRNDPYIQADALAEKTGLPISTVYRYLKGMQERCMLSKSSSDAPWSVLTFSI